MNTSSLDSFNKRKRLKNTITVYDDVDENLVNEFLNSKIDNEKVDNFFKSTSEFYRIDVSDEEAKEFLEQFKKDRNLNLVSAGATYIAPLGLYSKKYKTIEELPDKATIAIRDTRLHGL